MYSGSWSYATGNLDVTAYRPRSVVYGTDIYIFGIQQGSSGNPLDEMYIIDTITDTVSKISDASMSMAFSVGIPSVMLVNDEIFAFGGEIGGVSTSKWQYYR